MNPRLNDREHAEQVAVIDWAQWHESRWPELELLYAIPNGGYRDKRTAGRLRAEGVKSGVPDLFLPVARQGHHGLYIEMKAPGGRERIKQKWWRERLAAQGYKSVVCVGAEHAIEQLTAYLSGSPTTNHARAPNDTIHTPLAASGFFRAGWRSTRPARNFQVMTKNSTNPDNATRHANASGVPDEPSLDSIYTLCRLRELGVTHGQFMAHPFRTLAAIGQKDALESMRNGYLPLLPAQAAVAVWVRQAEEQNAAHGGSDRILSFPDTGAGNG